MTERKEGLHIAFAIIFMAIIIALFNVKFSADLDSLAALISILGYSALIILVAVFAKKLMAASHDIEITHSIWKIYRYGFYKRSYSKLGMPAGIFLPFIVSIITTGYTKVFTFLQFDAKALTSKIVKRIETSRFAQIMENELAKIAFAGLVSTLALALIADYFNAAELAKYAIYYSIANLFPISQLDGTKILMGSEPIDAKVIYIPSPLYILSLILTVIASLIVLI